MPGASKARQLHTILYNICHPLYSFDTQIVDKMFDTFDTDHVCVCVYVYICVCVHVYVYIVCIYMCMMFS